MFNVFRRLDKKEVPVTFSELFGSTDGIIVIPDSSPYVNEYKKLAEAWQKSQQAQNKNLKIVSDKDINELPNDKSIWILGFENRFAEQVDFSKNYQDYFSEDDKKMIIELRKNSSLVYAIPNYENESLAIGFAGSNNAEAIAGLARKLPHYGKYSYLGFEGNAPDNIWKGVFPAINSPLHIQLASDYKTKAKLDPRKALAGK